MATFDAVQCFLFQYTPRSAPKHCQRGTSGNDFCRFTAPRPNPLMSAFCLQNKRTVTEDFESAIQICNPGFQTGRSCNKNLHNYGPISVMERASFFLLHFLGRQAPARRRTFIPRDGGAPRAEALHSLHHISYLIQFMLYGLALRISHTPANPPPPSLLPERSPCNALWVEEVNGAKFLREVQ